MKNKYVKIGMIIIIAVVMALGLYEIINSIMFTENGKAISNESNSLVNYIKVTEDNIYRQEQINASLKHNKITKEQANILY